MKLLFLDIETAPNLAHVWQLWNVNNISLSQLRESSYTLCWAAKWAGSEEMYFGAKWKTDFNFIEVIHTLVDEADAVGTYNGDRFDIPTLRKDFILNGLPPPSPFKSIDLYKTVSKQFRFPSNKLAYIGEALGVGKKVEHEGHDLWVKVMAGDKKAQRDMEKYCIGDVILLEDVHDEVLPWIPNYPNRGLYDFNSGCPKCTHPVFSLQGRAYTLQGVYQRYRCSGCGSYFRGTKRLEGVDTVGL